MLGRLVKKRLVRREFFECGALVLFVYQRLPFAIVIKQMHCMYIYTSGTRAQAHTQMSGTL